MRGILNFLIKHNHWFLFLFLEGISFVLIVSFNNFQRATLFTSANKVAGTIYSTLSNVSSYFGLREENVTLLEQNRKLMNEIESLRTELNAYSDSAAIANNPHTHHNGYYYTTARVVNNSVNRTNNFLTIDKGTNHNVDSRMGVFNERGVIGITYTSSERYTVVLPLLNSKSVISCKVNDGNLYTISWDGKDIHYSYIVDLPRYEIFESGDTVVTSGFSSIFPEGVPIGSIESLEESADGQSYRARVKLFADFGSLDNVFIVGNDNKTEQEKLEKGITER